jgi:membrane-associated PAP2 superfamily phosphatase
MRYARIAAALACGALFIIWAGNDTDIDVTLADAMYDRAGAHFPWRHAWLADVASHRYLKVMLGLLGSAAVLLAAYDRWRPIASWNEWGRQRLRFVASSAMLIPAVIGLLKRSSMSHCPWDLAMYGGTETYVRLLERALPDVAAGHCLPAGHVSTALWLPSLAVFCLPSRVPGAAAILFLFAFAVGWLQQLRGAHFLTHTLWSVWWAALIMTVLHAALLRPRAGALAAVPANFAGHSMAARRRPR